MSGKVSQEKADGLAKLVGVETAKELLDMTKQATDILESKGVGWKEWMETAIEDSKEGKAAKTAKTTPPTASDEDEDEDEEDEAEAEAKTKKKATKEDGDVFEMELSDELIKEIALQVDVTSQVTEALKELLPTVFQQMEKSVLKAVKEAVISTNVASKEEIVQQAISGKLVLNKYSASKDDGTIVPEKEAITEAAKAEKEDKNKPFDPVPTLVSNMLQGGI